MSDTKILSDLQLSQIPQWTSKIRFIGNLRLMKHRKKDKIYFKENKRLLPIINLIKILNNMRNYDVVINANLNTAQLFGLFRSIFRIKSPKHIVLELMLDEEQNNFYWKIKRLMQRFIFSSVNIVFVSSIHEIDTYSERLNKPREHIKYLPFHTNIAEPRKMKSQNYILSAGKTGRDYGVLADAVKDMDQEVMIISDEHSVKGLNFPSNVKLLVNVPYSKYLDLLYNCRMVVVPLKKLAKSTGQVVFLEAMATGKPVIATATVGTKDYIQSGINGILVPPEDPDSLREAINTLINNPVLEDHISTNALESVRNLYTLENYCATILNTAEELKGFDNK